MNRRSWKRSESRIAGLLGGKRVPVSGRGRGDAPDVAHPWLSVEVKSRTIIPKWLTTALAQARAAAQEGQLPVAIIHKAGGRHDRSIVVMRLDDFTTWFGGVPAPGALDKDGAT